MAAALKGIADVAADAAEKAADRGRDAAEALRFFLLAVGRRFNEGALYAVPAAVAVKLKLKAGVRREIIVIARERMKHGNLLIWAFAKMFIVFVWRQ